MAISLLTLEKLLGSFFEQKKIKAHIWYYNEILVADIIEDVYKYAFDFSMNIKCLEIDLVARNQKTQNYLSIIFNNMKSHNKINLAKFDLTQYDEQDVIEHIDSHINYFMIKISVIIPVYNREKLIIECLNSLIRQTLNNQYFEVLLIDDYSNDESANVIQHFITKNRLKQFKLIQRSYNSGGAGLPRNDGIMLARGKYIFFLDSDDFIADNALENMLNFAEKNQSDILYIKYVSMERHMPVKAFKRTVGQAELSQNSLFLSLGPNKMFRREFLKNNKIYFPLGIKRGEDAMFMVTALCQSAKKSVLANQGYYHVTLHEEGHLYDKRELDEEMAVATYCIATIHASSLELREKINFLSVFLKRILTTLISIFRYSRYGWNEKEKEQWFDFVVRFFHLYLTNYNEQYLNQEMRYILKYIIYNNLVDLKLLYSIVNNIKNFSVKLIDGNFWVERNNKKFDLSFIANFRYNIISIEKMDKNIIQFSFECSFMPFEVELKNFLLVFIDTKEQVQDFYVHNHSVELCDNSARRVIFKISSNDFKAFKSKKWHIIFGLNLNNSYYINQYGSKLKIYKDFEDIKIEEVECYATKNGYIAVRK